MRAAGTGAVLLAVGLALAASVSAPAAAAEVVPLSDTPLEVQIWPGGELGYTLVTVTGSLPEDTPLPATVRLPLPEGVDVVWAGEILGGPVDLDPERPATVVQTSSGRALEITAEDARTVQYEAVGRPLAVAGGLTKSVFDWVQTVPTGDVVFSVRLPAGAETVVIDPEPVGSPRVNETGERLYVLRPVMLAEGQSYVVTVAFGPEGAGPDASSGVPILTVAVALLGVFLIVLVIVVVRERAPAR